MSKIHVFGILIIIIPCLCCKTIADGFCHSELSVNNGRGIYNWPPLLIGETISQVCQYGAIGQNVSRHCKSNWTWTEYAALCPTEVTNRFNQLNEVFKNVSYL